MLSQNPREALKDQQWEQTETSQRKKHDPKAKKEKKCRKFKSTVFPRIIAGGN